MIAATYTTTSITPQLGDWSDRQRQRGRGGGWWDGRNRGRWRWRGSRYQTDGVLRFRRILSGWRGKEWRGYSCVGVLGSGVEMILETIERSYFPFDWSLHQWWVLNCRWLWHGDTKPLAALLVEGFIPWRYAKNRKIPKLNPMIWRCLWFAQYSQGIMIMCCRPGCIFPQPLVAVYRLAKRHTCLEINCLKH